MDLKMELGVVGPPQQQSQELELCVVCGDRASGRHYGAISCEGCKGFFKRSIRKKLGYQCRGVMACEVTKHHRNRCQYCRLQKCLNSGMRSDSVQHERKPVVERNNSSAQSGNANNSSSSVASGSNYGSSGGNVSEQNGEHMMYMGHNSRETKEEPLDYARNSPPPPPPALHLAHLAAAAFKNSPGFPYGAGAGGNTSNPEGLPAGTPEDSRLLLHSHLLANNLLHMQQGLPPLNPLGALNINEYLQSAYGSAADVALALSQRPHSPTTIEEPYHSESEERWAALAQVARSPPPRHLHAHALCEAGARLLLLCCRWPPLHNKAQLSPELQLNLMKKCWPELFVLGLAQCAQALSLPIILPSLVAHLKVTSRQEEDNVTSEDGFQDSDKYVQAAEHLESLQNYIETLTHLRVDHHEYACLRALCMYSADVQPSVWRKTLWRHQQKCAQSLRNYSQNHSSNEDDDRFVSLLLQLLPLRSFSGDILEDIFFGSFLPDLKVDKLLPYLINAQEFA